MENLQNKNEFIKKEEGCRLTSYRDSVSVITIGYGSTMYKDGSKPKMGETITQQQADDLLAWEVENKSAVIRSLVKGLNENQQMALLSFTYNEGVGALAHSTLLKVIRKNPNDTGMIHIDEVQDASVKKWMVEHNWNEVNIIRMCFMMWNKLKDKKGAKVFSKAIMQRRLREADLYFTV